MSTPKHPQAARASAARLRVGFLDTEAGQLETLLTRLRDNVSAGR